MTWFKVDDGLAFHAKVVAAGNPAMGLWVRAGAWCSQHLTDGAIPAHIVRALDGEKDAHDLVDAGLWRETADGFAFHDWHQSNPLAADVERKRDEARQRMREVREKFAGRSREQNENVRENNARSSPNPDPTRPDPTKTPSESARKRATSPPDLFPITPALAAWGAENAPLVTDPRAETARFLDHHRAKGSTFKDWTAAWRTWMRRAQKFAEEERPPQGTDPTKAYLREQG